MTKTTSMTRNQNHHTTSMKKIETRDNGGWAPWSDLNHDVFFLVMMQLGFVDFLAFGGVCKSWRSLAVSNRNEYMASRTPMYMRIFKKKCCLEDFEGRRFRTTLPHCGGRICVGLTCGYLVLYGKETRDFWLVNPITRHELHFPNVTLDVYAGLEYISATIVFSPSLSEWVFVMSNRTGLKICFSNAGKAEWTCLSTPSLVDGLHAFKGKIYTLHSYYPSFKDSCLCERTLCEMTLYPHPELKILETKNILKLDFRLTQFVSLGENLYVINRSPTHIKNKIKIHKLDVDEMKWVPLENTEEEYAFFLCNMRRGFSGIQKRSQYGRYGDIDKSEKGRVFYGEMYFFHDCLKVNFLHM